MKNMLIIKSRTCNIAVVVSPQQAMTVLSLKTASSSDVTSEMQSSLTACLLIASFTLPTWRIATFLDVPLKTQTFLAPPLRTVAWKQLS